MLYIFRYEVNFQKGLSCGGAYIKLLTGDADLSLVKGCQWYKFACIYVHVSVLVP